MGTVDPGVQLGVMVAGQAGQLLDLHDAAQVGQLRRLTRELYHAQPHAGQTVAQPAQSLGDGCGE